MEEQLADDRGIEEFLCGCEGLGLPVAAIAAIRSDAAAVAVDRLEADLSNSAGYEAVIARLPAVDVLVNNVGINS